MNEGRNDRKSRLIDPKSGTWASSSQDFVRLANLLYEQSINYAKQTDGNCSIYTLAGIPVLFSALRCVLIEMNTPLLPSAKNAGGPEKMKKLAESANDIRFLLDQYQDRISDGLKKKLELLVEVRNEIIHPAHLPSGAKHNTPTYLGPLRHEGILQSTGKESDYVFIAQLQSHRLFRWAFEIAGEVVEIVITSHYGNNSIFQPMVESYSRYKELDRNL